MAEKPPTRKGAGQRASGKASETFTAEERAAMRERARESKRAATGAEGESEVLEKIAEMQGEDRAVAERLHAIVKDTAPDLAARTWYGMPAYAKDGKVVCFFKAARKFKTRYATLGFSDRANLDDGSMWPTDFAIAKLTPEVEAKITALVKQAVS